LKKELINNREKNVLLLGGEKFLNFEVDVCRDKKGKLVPMLAVVTILVSC